jgi:DNA-binding beta-propeller fold protein YncE
MRKVLALFVFSVWFAAPAVAQSFTAFESEQFHPLAMSPDGGQLFVVNTPDNRLEIFDVSAAGLTHVSSVNVGLEPVSVAARTDSEVWVVNHLSDSVSIVDLSGPEPRVIRTLLVGDEPRDIVFAGTGNGRAFITAAHRGQNSPYTDPLNPAEATTPGIGRADVWVFDVLALGADLGGAPIEIVKLFGDSPGALAVSPDGAIVYAAVFKSGNQTTALGESLICDGGPSAGTCESMPGELTSPGGLPAPNEDAESIPQPEVGLIVKYDGTAWRDEDGRDWSNQVRFNLPDLDVFSIDATATVPAELQAFPSVGTVLFGMVVNPSSGNLYVSNTDAVNQVRFVGTRPQGSSVTTVLGHIAEARITVIDPSVESVTPRHLNKHIDYNVSPATTAVRDASLAMPTGLAITADGATLYVTAKGSGKVGIFDTAELENNTFTPSPVDHIQLTGGGPTGLVLDEDRDRIYVLTRFDNTVSIIDTTTASEGQRVALFNPEPASITLGRPLLYDATYTSSNGEASCSSCHIAADKDELAWDLGDPLGSVLNNPNPFKVPPAIDPDFHPIKGPMLTQTLRGISNHGPLHSRGDQTGGNDPGGDPLDEKAAFLKFNPAFVGLLGRDSQLTAGEMDALSDFVMQLTPPPNPIRNLDNSLTAAQDSGRALFGSDPQACAHCHAIKLNFDSFGTEGNSAILGTQSYKIPHLRNLYERIGMFGRPDTAEIYSGDHEHMGDQVRGYGFLHDGSQDTLLRYNRLTNLVFPGGEPDRKDVEQFILAFVSDLKPVVGQQVTVTDSSSAAIHARADLLVALAEAGDAELVVKGTISGEPRGWYLSGADSFTSDKSAESVSTDAALRGQASFAGQELTYSAVPIGSGARVGIDRDLDAVLDGDDNCPAAVNPAQENLDGDSVGDACDGDTDGDGMTDEWEDKYGLNRLDPADASLDGDIDSLTNLEEFTYGTNPNFADTDGDWIKDGYELNFLGTDPNSSDTDGDTMPDFWEGLNWVGPTDPDSGSGDPDGDGFTNLEEYQNGTNPRRFDSSNAAPVLSAGDDQDVILPVSAALNASIIDDGLPVAATLNWSVVSGSGPVVFSDVSISNPSATFINPGVYALRLTANDTELQAIDVVQITVLAGVDSDADGMTDVWEAAATSVDPYDPADAALDPDNDGLTNLEEFNQGTDLNFWDSDGDNIGDGFEVNVLGTSPLLEDTDSDLMPDRWEAVNGLNPLNDDAGLNPDGDAYTNLQEFQNGTKPNSFDP